ncbi:MAG: GAF and ANTAR domain-containing protein [Acidobacteriota bacterium]|nr:GAF and ANTAR domain-containing protein [Acidobacteriota bacterium]
MPGERLERIISELSAGGEGPVSSRRLCETSKAVLGVAGAGVMLMSGDVAYGSLCATNAVSTLIEELQFGLGEGPCVDAYTRGEVIAEPDLADPAVPRWSAFVPPALGAGVRAVFAFPLRVGAVRLGALDLYCERPGSLSDDQHADALVVADVVASWVLDTQGSAPPGNVAAALGADADFHLVVHNAAGMVSVQLDVSVAEALVRLRAYAFSHDRPLTAVAEDIVNRRLRLE